MFSEVGLAGSLQLPISDSQPGIMVDVISLAKNY
jgi:hypothetical protein